MSKVWLMALYEFKRHVLQKKFIFALLSVPFFISLMIGVGAIAAAMVESTDAVGYVDHAGLLDDPVPAPEPGSNPDNPSSGKMLPLLPYDSEEAAQRALEADEIQAFYVLEPDYFETKNVELVYYESPDWSATRQFWDFLQVNLLDDLPAEVANRAVAGSNVVVRWPDDAPGGGREFSESTFLNNFVPLIIAFGFVFLLFAASGYLMGAVVEEKENRTMEILITSISSNQLMAGKIVGILGVVFTQLLAWVAFGVLAVYVGGHYLDITQIQNVSLDLKMVLTTAAIAIPPFVMLAGFMTAIGATVAEAQEAQQVTGLLIFPYMIPIYLIQPLIEHPNGPLAVGMSLFPPTAVVTFGLRLAFSQVPTWQIFASIAVSSLCALGAIWLAGRAFRLGMLRYGQRLNWRHIFARKQLEGVRNE